MALMGFNSTCIVICFRFSRKLYTSVAKPRVRHGACDGLLVPHALHRGLPVQHLVQKRLPAGRNQHHQLRLRYEWKRRVAMGRIHTILSKCGFLLILFVWYIRSEW